MGYKLSIIIPIYNVEKYIADCLHSIFDQNAEGNYEVILVNDGTKDRSMEIAREICSGKPNVTVAEQENQGLSTARMRGLAEAKGEYVWFVDSDDYLEGNAIDYVINLINNNREIGIFMFPLHTTVDNTHENYLDYHIEDATYTTGKSILKKGDLPIWGSVRYVIKRDIFRNKWIGFPEGLSHEDEYFGRALLYTKEKIMCLHIPIYTYRKRAMSTMTNRDIRSSYNLINIFHKLKEFENNNVLPEDLIWFSRHVYMGTLVSSYSISKRLIG